MYVDIIHTRFELESSKENLLQTILENRDDLNTDTIVKAIKEFVKNHDKYYFEKKRRLEVISEDA